MPRYSIPQRIVSLLGPLLKAIRLYDALRWIYREVLYAGAEGPYRFSARWNRRSGVTKSKRSPELIVSLTSIPSRMASLHLCLDSLLRQSTKPDRLILWLSESGDPARPTISAKRLPRSLTRLCKRGLEIRWCDDLRSYRKLVPTLKAFPNALIVTADDDFLYPRNWLRDLYEAYLAEPEYIHCHRAHLMIAEDDGTLKPYLDWDFLAPGYTRPSMMLFPTGCGGVLYAPGHLDREVLNESAFLSLCPRADDVWFKAMSLKAGVPCKKVSGTLGDFPGLEGSQSVSLMSQNWQAQGGNDDQIRAVFENYRLYDSLTDRAALRARNERSAKLANVV